MKIAKTSGCKSMNNMFNFFDYCVADRLINMKIW